MATAALGSGRRCCPEWCCRGVHECVCTRACETQLGGAAPELPGGRRSLCDGLGPTDAAHTPGYVQGWQRNLCLGQEEDGGK